MRNQMLIRVLIAIVLAFLAGWIAGPDTAIFGIPWVRIFGLIGQLFLNALTLLVVPLVISSIITGAARMGSDQSFGKLGTKTFAAYIGTNFSAIIVGALFALLISPGQGLDLNLAQLSANSVEALSAQSYGTAFDKLEAIFLRLIPANIIATAAQGQMLGLIGFSLLFGFFISKIETTAAHVVLNFWKGIFQIMMSLTHFVMKALPIGVFGLVAKVTATTGFDAVRSVTYFFATILISLGVFGFIVLPFILMFIAKVNPWLHLKAVAPALFAAFSTSSSAASLPVTLECVEQRAGVSNRICSFTLPLGISLNLAGSALYICVGALFISQAYGLTITAANVFLIIILSLITSMGLAGIPSAALISLVIILGVLGIPAEGVGLIMAVERLLDMFRTAINVLSNTCCAVIIARSEGEKDVLRPIPMEIHHESS